MVEQTTLHELLSKHFPDSSIKITDLAGDQDHYEAVIVSALFEGKNRVQRQRMVYQALGGMVGNQLHALSLKTLTPEEAKK